MSLRCIWIVRMPRPNENCQIILKRVFTLAEQRAEAYNGNDYVPIPSDEDFGKNLLLALGSSDSGFEFVEWRDSIDKQVQRPAMDVKTDRGIIWPLIVVDHGNLLLCSLPLVEFSLEEKRPALFHISSVTVAFSVLEGIRSLLGTQGEPKIEEVKTFIGLCLPFGRPYDTDPSNAMTLLAQCDDNCAINFTQKSSVKNPTPTKGKSAMVIGIRETVRCIQWYQAQPQNVVEVFGSLLVKAELENNPSDVTVALGHWEKGENLTLENMIYHPCLHNTNWVNAETNSSSTWKKIKFTPPSHQITLCNYTSPQQEPPIYGQYALKGQQDVQIEFQLQLSKHIKNTFNYCEARFPFSNRGKIRHVDCKPTWGHVHLTDDKQTLVWNIGQKFPKSLQVSLLAKVKFVSGSTTADPKLNSTFAQLQFLMQDFAMSGCYIDTKTIQFTPACKVKVHIERELRSGEYKIWNRNSEAPYSIYDDKSVIPSES